jgi:hypothetical protein
MTAPRPAPFALVFEQLAGERFPAIRDELEASGSAAADRDAFLLARSTVQLLHDLRPDEGLGEAMDQMVALVHHAFLYWSAGAPTVAIPRERLEDLLGVDAPAAPAGPDRPAAWYAQLPEHRVWAEVMPGEPHEPLDGCFVHPAVEGLRVLGIFGLHPERGGFTVVEAIGDPPARLERPDGTPLFAPVLPGGDAAGLHSLVGMEELLELGRRTGSDAWTA